LLSIPPVTQSQNAVLAQSLPLSAHVVVGNQTRADDAGLQARPRFDVQLGAALLVGQIQNFLKLGPLQRI
jgi:hypothetical protein